MANRVEVLTDEAPKPGGPYSQAIVCNGMVFVAGQLGYRPEDGELVPGGMEAETLQTFKNLEAVLASAGSSVKDLVKVTVYLKDLADFSTLNRLFADFVKPCEVKPARTTFQAGAMPRESRIEIDVIAIIPDKK